MIHTARPTPILRLSQAISSIALLSLLFLGGCQIGKSDQTDLSKLKCDQSGCLLCEQYTCYQYSCDTDWQCPEGYLCTASKQCMPQSADTPPIGSGGPGISQGSTGGTSAPTTAAPTTAAPSAATCSLSAECAPGTLCVNGVCAEAPSAPEPTEPIAECAANSDCGAAEFCNAGTCDSVDFPLRPEGTCQFSTDCGQTGTCVNTKCYFPPAAGEACPHGAALAGDLCMPQLAAAMECQFNSDCGQNNLCINATCERICTADADCAAGNFCGGAGLCVLDDRPTLQCLSNGDCAASSCVDGRCLEACGADSTCGSDAQMCSFGFCMQTATCFAKKDCATGFDCINGACGTLGDIEDAATPADPPADPPADDPAPSGDAGTDPAP